MPSDFDNNDDTPNLGRPATTVEQEYRRLALQRETDLHRLERDHRVTVQQAAELRHEIIQLRESAEHREDFYAALQRAFVVLEGQLRRERELRQQFEQRLDGLRSAMEIVVCQQPPITLPNWRKTHVLTLGLETVNERRLDVMACYEPGRAERRYRLYQHEEYRIAAEWMRAGFEQPEFRCLRFADYEFYAGNLFFKNARWWNAFSLDP